MTVHNGDADDVVGLRHILPAYVAIAESFGDIPGAALLPGEEWAVAGAVGARRREYASVRHCARRALAELDVPAGPIPHGPGREPIWPVGVVGSMTHCAGYRGAAVARAENVTSLGIDAEPHEPLPAGVLEAIARPEELLHLRELAARAPEVYWDRLLFSAKEAVYKAWFPLTRSWLGFDEATIDLDPAGESFSATLHRSGLRASGRALRRLSGRWIGRGGLVVTAVVLGPAGPA